MRTAGWCAPDSIASSPLHSFTALSPRWLPSALQRAARLRASLRVAATLHYFHLEKRDGDINDERDNVTWLAWRMLRAIRHLFTGGAADASNFCCVAALVAHACLRPHLRGGIRAFWRVVRVSGVKHAVSLRHFLGLPLGRTGLLGLFETVCAVQQLYSLFLHCHTLPVCSAGLGFYGDDMVVRTVAETPFAGGRCLR
jgi:hypothetical protein